MLLCDVAYWDGFAIAVDDMSAEHALSFKNPLRVMPKGPVPNVTEGLLRLVEPLVDRHVVFGLAAPVAYAALGVEDRTGHSSVSSRSDLV